LIILVVCQGEEKVRVAATQTHLVCFQVGKVLPFIKQARFVVRHHSAWQICLANCT